jgi:20S proteasome alpha/beta subunit
VKGHAVKTQVLYSPFFIFYTLYQQIMECLFGITGKDFTLLAGDTVAARSIVVMKATEDKSRELTPHTVLFYTGEPGDTVNFAEFIQRNIRLYGIRNGIELSPKAAANYTRRELADSLRSKVQSKGIDYEHGNANAMQSRVNFKHGHIV